MPRPVMSREDALAALEWAKQQPDIVQAYSDRNHPAYATLQEYASNYYYWAYEHPQTPDGRPVPCEELPDFQPLTANEERRLQALENLKRGRLDVALDGPLAEAYRDPQHPDHRAIHQEMSRLYEEAEMPYAEPASDAQVSTARDRLDTLRAEIAADPKHAYNDKRHPGHERAVAEVQQAYDRAFGAAPAARPGATNPVAAARQRLADIRRQLSEDAGIREAYLNEGHADHARVTAIVESAYAAAYPSDAPSNPSD